MIDSVRKNEPSAYEVLKDPKLRALYDAGRLTPKDWQLKSPSKWLPTPGAAQVAGVAPKALPAKTAAEVAPAAPAAQPAAAPTGQELPVYSTFTGSVELVDITVKTGDEVTEGQTVAVVEAMKATHDIKTLHAGTVVSVQAQIGDEVDNTKPILTIATKG